VTAIYREVYIELKEI